MPLPDRAAAKLLLGPVWDNMEDALRWTGACNVWSKQCLYLCCVVTVAVAVMRSAVLSCAISITMTLWTVPHCSVLYSTVLYSTVSYCTVSCYSAPYCPTLLEHLLEISRQSADHACILPDELLKEPPH